MGGEYDALRLEQGCTSENETASTTTGTLTAGAARTVKSSLRLPEEQYFSWETQ